VSEVDWEQLNPARGDASPRAATLWGDRKADVPTGFLVRFVDGFSSPPHIHNVSYRGVVIKGLVHNDDPRADAQWMPPGSYWTQPKDGEHITSAKGGDTIAYIEIDSGPYLVRPASEARAGEEQPINVDASNIVWVRAQDLGWQAPDTHAALLWGDPLGNSAGGMLVRLKPGTTITLQSKDAPFGAVVIKGTMSASTQNSEARGSLAPGSSIEASAGAFALSCTTQTQCTVYVRALGSMTLAP